MTLTLSNQTKAVAFYEHSIPSRCAAVQRVNLNTEKANKMEVGSARRMKGNSAEISILKSQYTEI